MKWLVLMLILMVLCQLCVCFLMYRVGLHIIWAIAQIVLPFGIGLFLTQLFYYERHYPNWSLPLNKKLPLKYMYLLTFLEYVGLYIILFVL